jgi:hypothetical protein
MLPTIIGGVFGAASSVMQGRAQAKAYEAQAQAAENNKQLALKQGSESLREGAREEYRFRRQQEQFAASQESLLAANGAQVSGSALNILADTASGIEEDAAMIRYNTLKKKWGYDAQAVNFGNEASAARASAKNATRAGTFGAVTSILGTAASVYAASPINVTNNGNGVFSVGEPDDYMKMTQGTLNNNYTNSWQYRGFKYSPVTGNAIGQWWK